jgi:WD40 repeat protein
MRLITLPGRGQVFNLAISCDGRYLALGKQDGGIELVDWASQQTLWDFVGHDSDVAGIAFNHEGRRLATAGLEDRAVKIWELEGMGPGCGPPQSASHTLAAPSFLCDVAFSPDGQRLAGISRDLVKLWVVETGHEVLTLRGAPQRHWDPAFNPRVTFSADGQRLAGTNWDESVSVWDVVTGTNEEAEARRQADRRRAADQRVLFWHLQEADHCFKHKNLAAAKFHLERLGETRLTGLLQRRRDQLAKQLAEPGSK